MATIPNKKSIIRELMYLEQGRKDKEREVAFKGGTEHSSFTVDDHARIICAGDERQLSLTVEQIDPERHYFPPDEED